MIQITTNLTDAEDGFLKGKRYVPIITTNVITGEWAIGSSCPVTRWGVPLATSSVGNVSAACCGITTAKRPDRGQR